MEIVRCSIIKYNVTGKFNKNFPLYGMVKLNKEKKIKKETHNVIISNLLQAFVLPGRFFFINLNFKQFVKLNQNDIDIPGEY